MQQSGGLLLAAGLDGGDTKIKRISLGPRSWMQFFLQNGEFVLSLRHHDSGGDGQWSLKL